MKKEVTGLNMQKVQTTNQKRSQGQAPLQATNGPWSQTLGRRARTTDETNGTRTVQRAPPPFPFLLGDA